MKKSRLLGACYALLMVVILFNWSHASMAATVIDSATAATFDPDGDGTYEIYDNAPGATNPGQGDADGDGIGDAIDPNPYLPDFAIDVGLDIGGPYTITAGSSLDIALSIDSDPYSNDNILVRFELGLNGIIDGWLIPFSSVATISPSFLVYDHWDLNTPGNYDFRVEILSPGVFGIAEGTVTVSNAPLPAALWLFGSGLLGLVGIARRKKAA